jgi:cobalt-zinc-cadmium resistance protein CzcA
MSIKGTGANDVVYGYGTRFSAVQFGLQVPIFLGHQRARIKAAKLSESIAQAEYITEQQKLQSKQAQLMAAYNSGTDAARYYEEKGLKNAGVMRRAAVKAI